MEPFNRKPWCYQWWLVCLVLNCSPVFAATLDYGLDFLRAAPPSLASQYFSTFNQFDQAFVGTDFDFHTARRIAEERGMGFVGRIDKKYIAIERCSQSIPVDIAIRELNFQLQREMQSELSLEAQARLKGLVLGMFTPNRADVLHGKSVRMLAGAIHQVESSAIMMLVPLELFFVQMPYGSCSTPSYWLRAEAEAYE